MWVSYDTIYHPHQLRQYLPRAHRQHHKIFRVDEYVQTVSCSGCLSMDARHTSTTAPCSDTWESDSIVGAKTVGDGIHPEAARVSRFIITRKTNALTAERQITAHHSIFSALSPHARLPVTMGNGTEMHRTMNLSLGRHGHVLH